VGSILCERAALIILSSVLSYARLVVKQNRGLGEKRKALYDWGRAKKLRVTLKALCTAKCEPQEKDFPIEMGIDEKKN